MEACRSSDCYVRSVEVQGVSSKSPLEGPARLAWVQIWPHVVVLVTVESRIAWDLVPELPLGFPGPCGDEL